MIITKKQTAELFIILCFTFHGSCSETDTIASNFSITDPDFIVSTGRVFKLGFFTPANTTNRYLAVYYVVSENSAVWVANRDSPLRDSSGTVTISSDGNLVLIDGRNETIWSTNVTSSALTNSSTAAQILDTGNLVLRDVRTGNVLWESFSHPSSVFMAGMSLTDNVITGRKVRTTSWKSPSDPGVGNFTAGLQARDVLQIFTWENGRPHFRSGPWNGVILIGVKSMYSPYLDGFIVGNDSGNFYFTAPRVGFLMKDEINSSGFMVKTLWDDQARTWDVVWVAPENECDVYGTCGPFGLCDPENSPICSCLRGFEPVNRDEWGSGNWTSGCARRTELRCDGEKSDGFLRMPFMKVPDFAEALPDRSENECRVRCLSNCSCLAYSHDPTIGCMFWSETLIDIQQFDGVGPDLHVRLASSELGNRIKSDPSAVVHKDESEKININELPLFTFKMLADATSQFHEDNKLGRGGFGHVYKGKLETGENVAVKRLSGASRQGTKEFMTETVVISKVQHRNLVKLLGSCVEGEEKMLVYEYLPNKSLDACLFDPKHPSRKILDWKKRFSIIEGIGRGLLYLHTDSRLKIIHRDLKPSNVLLDEDYNPKISDFGIARVIGGNQDQANTARVIGTYGYMAPEYAMNGRFSEKSDVYSFGVLMLEIVSGKKNTKYYNQEWSLSLLGCAWKLWNEDNSMAFADQTIANTDDFQAEIVRCIHIALLCVQEFPKDRPTVRTVLSMLSRETVDLPTPDQPFFAEKWDGPRTKSTQPPGQFGFTVNELTITGLDGR